MAISLTVCINSKSQLSTPENGTTERNERSQKERSLQARKSIEVAVISLK